MSGVGIPQSGLSSLVNLANPDLAAEQAAALRRQNFAQSLLTQGPSPYTGFGGAADNIGSKIIGALMSKNADKENLSIAKQYRDALFNQTGMGGPPPGQPPLGNTPMQQAPQQSASPPLASLPSSAIPAIAGRPNTGVQQSALPPLGSLPPSGLQAPPQAQQVAQVPPQQPSQGQQGQQSLFQQAVPDIPGIDPRNKFALYASDPASYMKAYYASQAQPDTVKAALFASNGDPNGAQQDVQAQERAKGTTEYREGGFGVGPDGKIIYGPNENSNTFYTTGPNGEPIAHPIQGGAESAALAAGARKGAEEQNTITEVTLPDGRKVPMYVGAALGAPPSQTQGVQPQQPPLGIRNNNPGNLQPGGKEASYSGPTAGILAASSNLDNYAKQGINTLSGIISKWAPPTDATGKPINDTPAYIADVSSKLGNVDPNRPLNLSDPNVKGAVLDAMFAHENGNKANPQPPATQPGLPQLGVSTAQNKVNEAAGEAAANSGHINANSDALLKAIDGMIAINDKVPDSTILPPDWKAKINQFAPNLPAFKGDAGALANWEQLNSIGVLGGIKNLGIGRLDIPIVKQIQAGGGIPADVPAADRLKMLQTLKTEVTNNRAAAQNTASNLNSPNAASPQQSPMASYGASPRIRHYNPQTGRLE